MSTPEEGQTPSQTPNLPLDMGRKEPDPPMDTGGPEPEWIRRISYDEEAELTAGLSKDFSGQGEDAMRWILAKTAYFIINEDTYSDKAKVLVMLNKMSIGRGATFFEGWYHKIFNKELPPEQKTFKRLSEDLHQTFILKDLQDQACQELYSLSMSQYNGNFNKYASAFQLAQAHSRIDLESILVDVLQQGVTNQLAVIMTSATLPDRQTSWRWEQWLDKAREFYRNMVWLRNLKQGNSYVAPGEPPQKWVSSWKKKTNLDPDTMDINQVDLPPYEKRRHMKEDRCFQCHSPRC